MAFILQTISWSAFMFVYGLCRHTSHSLCLIKFGSALLTNCGWFEASSVTQGSSYYIPQVWYVVEGV